MGQSLNRIADFRVASALLAAVLFSLLLITSAPAAARTPLLLSDETIATFLPRALVAGVRDPKLPVWPILENGETVAYVFESNALAPLPGFSGSPIDLLIIIDREGKFREVSVLSHNEPVFAHGLGPQPLFDFVAQYRGKSLRDNIKVVDPHTGPRRADVNANSLIDGVTKATASVRIVNETVLASALMVARAKLPGVTGGPARDLADPPFRRMSWDELRAAGLIGELRLSKRQVGTAFAGSGFSESSDSSNIPFIDLYVAPLDQVLIAGNLFKAPGLQTLAKRFDGEPNLHAIAVMASGAGSIMGPDFIPNTVPDRLRLTQNGLSLDIRDSDSEMELMPGVPRFDEIMILKLDSRLGYDPSQPWSLALRVVRRKGIVYPETASRDFAVEFRLPETMLKPLVKPPPAWVASWVPARWTLAAIGGMVVVLVIGLAGQRALVRVPRLLYWGRLLFLAATVGVIGWYGQGQLSIVNLLALIKALRAGNYDLSFFLFDPISTALWGVVAVTLFIWGRGTFCGWLCPFGALQEFVAELARRLKLRQIRISPHRERQLGWGRFVVLGVLIGGTVWRPDLSETLAEAEPFKTAITLGFWRYWPFVVYAGLTIGVSLFVFKGYCRFLCPLGGALALLGRVRIFAWIPRRAECGKPCQLCARRCRYGAIAATGRVAYAECFQCLDCVAIHDDAKTCVPLVLLTKRSLRARQQRTSPDAADRR